MLFRATVKKEQEFNFRMFNTICSEVLEDNPNDSEEELVKKCYDEMINTFIEDYGYEVISVNEDDKNKLIYWIKQNIKDIKGE